MQLDKNIQCPYCGESQDTLLDCTTQDSDGNILIGEQQRFSEDCQICCRPIVYSFSLDSEGDLMDFAVFREDECTFL